MHKIAVVAATCLPFLMSGIAYAQGPYEFPLRASDLKPNERYSTVDHKGTIQTEGKDIGARRHQSGSTWSDLEKDNGDKDVNDDWLVYGKPFYAMASGTVVACWRNAPDDPPGRNHPDAAKIPSSGNHLWVLQDDGVYALYGHAKPGTILPHLCPHNAKLLTSMKRTGGNPDMRVEAQVTNGAKIKVGDKLGEIGNSGDTSGPHLHVHMEKDGKPVVMPFRRGMTTSYADWKGNINGPWTPLAGKAMSNDRVLVWAPRGVGNYTFNGVLSANYQRMVDHLVDSGMMPNLITCKSNGQSYDSSWVPAKGAWATHHGMSAATAKAKHAEYTAKGYSRTSSYTCGTISVAVWRKS